MKKAVLLFTALVAGLLVAAIAIIGNISGTAGQAAGPAPFRSSASARCRDSRPSLRSS